jgi:hypothetical protein
MSMITHVFTGIPVADRDAAGTLETIGDAVRRTTITDADGNRLNVGQPPPQAAGS